MGGVRHAKLAFQLLNPGHGHGGCKEGGGKDSAPQVQETKLNVVAGIMSN